MSAGSRHSLEIRQGVEREIHFARRTSELIAIDLFEKIVWQIPLFDHFDESKSRIDTRRNNVGVNLVSARQRHAFCFATLHDDLRNRRLGAYLNSGLARRIRYRVRNRAGAAAGKSPGAERAVDFSHIVMQ